MLFDSWLLGLIAAAALGAAIHALATGRATSPAGSRLRRSEQPARHWAFVLAILAVAGVAAWAWRRSLAPEQEDDLRVALFLGPWFLYALIDALWSGEASVPFSRDPALRAARPHVYWASTALHMALNLVFAWLVADTFL